MIKSLRVTHSENLYRDQLGGDLYADVAALLWEIVRNHCVGCMDDPKVWSPGSVHVELQLVADWRAPDVVWAPPVGTRCLFVFDSGHGFREDDFERFSHVGRKKGSADDRFGGGSQKCLGRFAGLALNSSSQRDSRCGYMVYTRTAEWGTVVAMEATSYGFANGELPRREIPPDSSELGPYSGRRGSFSLVVIPNCVFVTHQEIAELLKWYLPRKQDRAIDVLIGGKRWVAPPLAKQVITYGGIEAYLDRYDGKDQKGGIWLCDLDSGLRCAFAPAMSQDLPWPLGKERLLGEIFIKNLYRNQNTSRSGIKREFLSKSKEWKAALAILQLKVAPFARDLLDLEEETFGDSSGLDHMVRDMADIFIENWGVPANLGPGVWDVEGGVVVPPVRTGGGHGGGHGGHGHRPINAPDVARPRRAAIPITINGQTYFLGKSRQDECVFAALAGDLVTININPAYTALPAKAAARMEHAILGVLRAVAEAENMFYGDARKASRLVAELRSQLKKTPKKPKP